MPIVSSSEISLKLTVIAYKGLPPLAPLEFHVGQSGGVVGRSADNDIVLPDPEKFVSRRHGSFSFDQGHFTYTDSSTAGTPVVNRGVLLHNDTIALADGDRLKIGDYEIETQLVRRTEDFTAGSPEIDHRAPWPPFPESPEHEGGEPLSADDAHYVITPQEVPAPADSELQSFLRQPDVAPQHGYFSPPEPVPGTALNELPEFDVEDLFRDHEAEAPPESSPAAGEAWQVPDDFFGAKFLDLERIGESATPNAGIATPTAEVPDDKDRGGGYRGVAETDGSAPSSASPASLEPLPGIAPAPPPIAETSRAPLQPAARAAAAPPLGEPSAPAGFRPAPDPDLFRLFLEGAGIHDVSVDDPEQIRRVAKTAGVLFHHLIEGLMTALQARAEAKRELRVSMTTMRSADNNPLKSVPNPELAMTIMLTGKQPGFANAIEAVREAFRDLMSHQMATTAGIQASLAGLLRQFDPENFEKRFEEGIVFQKKAKCWDAYKKAYPDLVNASLDNLFGDAFAEVYEQQMRILSTAPGDKD